MFDEVNSSQWLWYYYNYLQDEKDKFETSRDLIEYHASFIEPEAVRKIREARDQSIEIPEKQFMSGIEQIFGRKISNIERPTEKTIHKVDLGKVLTNYKETVKEQVPKTSYKDWLNSKMEK